MIGPKTYLEEIKDKSYEELLEEKKRLIDEIDDFENDGTIKTGIIIDPSPEVRYQVNLEYLAELCILLAKKYNEKINRNN